jgi:hypothetical protein
MPMLARGQKTSLSVSQNPSARGGFYTEMIICSAYLRSLIMAPGNERSLVLQISQ